MGGPDIACGRWISRQSHITLRHSQSRSLEIHLPQAMSRPPKSSVKPQVYSQLHSNSRNPSTNPTQQARAPPGRAPPPPAGPGQRPACCSLFGRRPGPGQRTAYCSPFGAAGGARRRGWDAGRALGEVSSHPREGESPHSPYCSGRALRSRPRRRLLASSRQDPAPVGRVGPGSAGRGGRRRRRPGAPLDGYPEPLPGGTSIEVPQPFLSARVARCAPFRACELTRRHTRVCRRVDVCDAGHSACARAQPTFAACTRRREWRREARRAARDARAGPTDIISHHRLRT